MVEMLPIEDPPLALTVFLYAAYLLVLTPVLALPTALGLSRERSFGQRYWRGYLACMTGLFVTTGLAGLEPATAWLLLAYALAVAIVLLLSGESLYRAVIGVLAPFAFLFTFLMIMVVTLMLTGGLGGIGEHALGLAQP